MLGQTCVTLSGSAWLHPGAGPTFHRRLLLEILTFFANMLSKHCKQTEQASLCEIHCQPMNIKSGTDTMRMSLRDQHTKSIFVCLPGIASSLSLSYSANKARVHQVWNNMYVVSFVCLCDPNRKAKENRRRIICRCVCCCCQVKFACYIWRTNVCRL